MLDRYIQLLEAGEIVAFPTETVYGLGADAWNPTAIQKVFDQKERPSDNPLIVHVSSMAEVEHFALEISEDARQLMKAFWPGPLTLIFKKKPEVLDLVTAGLDTVAVRWPSHPLSQDLIANTGPLVAPSANSSGRPSPTRADHVREDFGADFPVVDAGETAIGLESTVIDLSERPYTIYRPGAVSAKEITKKIDAQVQIANNKPGAKTKSPGTKYTHYAPDASVGWLPEERTDDPDTLYLLHSGRKKGNKSNVIQYNGNFKRMAHELYDRFRQADHNGFHAIAIETFPNKEQDSLIPALTNRITKAIG